MGGSDDVAFAEASRRIKRGDIASVRAALDQTLDPNKTNRFGWTLLMVAAGEGQVSIGEVLLSRGADPNRANRFGHTALWSAVLGGHLPFVRLLLANGARTEPLLDPAEEAWMNSHSGQPTEKTQQVYELLRQSN